MCVFCDSLRPPDCSSPGSSVHGILQERILEWVVIPFCKGSSLLRDQTWVSCIEGGFFTIWATREVHVFISSYLKLCLPVSVRHLLPHFSPQSPEEGFLQTCSYQLISEKLPKGKDLLRVFTLLYLAKRYCGNPDGQHLSLFFPITWENCKMRKSVLQRWHEWTSFENTTTFSSVQSCLTLCDPMNCGTPSLPVCHQFPELTQTHVHRVSDAIQPSHPLSS